MDIELRQIMLLPPHLVPNAEEIADWIGARLAPQLSASSAATEDAISPRDATTLEQTVLEASLPPLSSLSQLPGNPEDAAHDLYFCVRRMEGDRSALLLQMIFAAQAILLEETPVQDSPESAARWTQIAHGLSSFAEALLGKFSNSYSPVKRSSAPTFASVVPRRRWVRGHQLFAVLTQGLIFSLTELGHAIRADEQSQMKRYLTLSLSLLRASGSTFVFTGDFSITDYMQDIRPTMMPPMTAISLSGLMSADHRHLVRILREMRPILKALRVLNPEGHDDLAAALSDVYELHKHVCERFVGDRPSIRTAQTTDKSGPTVLEQFRKLRLKPFENE